MAKKKKIRPQVKKYNQEIDVIIPAYNVPDHILFRCLASIACQDIVSEVKVTIVDDASTEQNYQQIANCFSSIMDIEVLRYEENGGPGVARQYGIDHTSNGYMTFIDADDTLVGSLALKALRKGIELDNGTFQMCVGVFDEIHEENVPLNEGPILMPHENDMIWMFGKLYRRQFIDKYKIRFHESSRANEDNGFNTICRLCANEKEQIKFIPAHVYYWHENPNSITRANDCQYSYGDSKRDSFYGYVENMIYAVKEAKKRNPFNGFITMWAVNCMLNIYEYYIECAERAPEFADQNFLWCKRYYDEVYADLKDDISDQMLSEQYNDVMRNAYMGDKLSGIIPCMGVFEFLDKLENYEPEEEEELDDEESDLVEDNETVDPEVDNEEE